MNKQDQSKTGEINNEIKELLEIEDKGNNVEQLLEKALFIVNSLSDDYFCKYNTKSEEGRQRILIGYGRYKTMNEILCDYIVEIRNETNDLVSEINTLRDKTI